MNIKKTVVISIALSSMLFASAYRVPEQSINSTALSAAYVANANGADASYFNPANMVFNENFSQMEAAFTYIGLSKIKYEDNRASLYSGRSKSEAFLMPTMHFASKAYNDFRYGLSVTAPGGLSKRWADPYPKTFAEEFSLKIVEINPTLAYKINDNFAIGGGVRAIYSEGIVKSSGLIPVDLPAGTQYTQITRDMDGDTVEFGYNVAMTYKVQNNLKLSATYRSNIDLSEEGHAALSSTSLDLGAGSSMPGGFYDGGAGVTVPLPAVLAVALAYDFGNTTVEFTYDRTYWSEYKDLDFIYDSPVLHPILSGAFDDAKDKSWKDVNAFRIGVTHKYDDKLTLMAAYGIDKNPVPSNTLSFELPDSDAQLFSTGFRYKHSEKLDYGISLLFDKKESRSVVNDAIDGTFTGAKAYLFTAGIAYKF